MIKKAYLVLFTIGLCLVNLTAMSQSNISTPWLQFRGGQKDGLVSEEKIPSWSEKKPVLAWKKEVGSGFPEVLISGDRLYIHFGDSVSATSGEFVMACDMETGKEIWKTEIDSLYIDPEKWGDGPRATPAMDSENIYCFTAYGKLVALSLKDGKEIWRRDVVKEFGSRFPRYAFSSSPLLVGGVLFLETGGNEERAFSAFNPKNGKTQWSKKKGRSSYNSPIIANINNEDHIVMVFDSMLVSFDLKGNQKWEYKMPLRSPTAVPVFIKPNKFFVSSVSPTGSFVIEINDNKATEVCHSPKMKNNWSSSVYYNGHIYGFNSSKLQCNTLDGTIKWSKRGFGKGSLIIVGDQLFVLSDKGVLKQISASPDAYVENGSVQALEGKSWTAPSYSQGRLFLRNLSEMSSYIIK
jgi:outer membrane protein assembly factor BamB